MRWLAWVLVLATSSCDGAPAPAGRDAARSSAPARSSKIDSDGAKRAPATRATAPDLDDVDDVETVDDTIPPDDVAASTADSADDGASHRSACAPKDAKLKPMQLLRFTFSDGVEGKDPSSKIAVAKAGQRVYAHLTMRNRSGRKRCLHLTFRVGGKKRTSVTLEIGKSWEWRTYAYNTLRGDDNRPLELTVTDDQGALVLKKLLAVIPRKNR